MGKQKRHKAYNTSKTSKNKYKRTEEQNNKPNDSIAHPRHSHSNLNRNAPNQ